MMKNLAIVQIDAQMQQSPYFAHPRKVNSHLLASRRFAGKPLAEWLVRRVSDAQHVDGVIVVVRDSGEQQQITQLIPNDIPVFVSSKADPLARFVDAMQAYPSEGVIRVSIENPFVDPSLIDRLVITSLEHPTCDYIGYRTAAGQSALESSIGFFAEWYRSKAILRAEQESKSKGERFDIGRALLDYPEIFQLRLLLVPEPLNREDVRLSVCGDEDWQHSLEILEALGADSLDWQEVVQLIHQQPQISGRMAQLNGIL
ncbi:MAG: cytidylyltransferase domain-containing protein [Pirellulales bacterium]